MKKNWRNKNKVETKKGLNAAWFMNGFHLPTTLSQLLAVTLLLLVACTNGKKQAEQQIAYTCPMHPSVVTDKPGTCPICGMNLVRRTNLNEEIELTEDLASLVSSPNEAVSSSVKTIKGDFRSMPVVTAAQGIVTYDTRNVFTIPARIGGRLEKVYLKYIFQKLRKGQKVADIYSPELVAAQRELLYLVENDSMNTGLIASAKERLYLLGVTKNQVSELIGKRKVFYSFPIYSQYSGYVIGLEQQVPVLSASAKTSGMKEGMGGALGETSSASPSPMTVRASELIREGNYVSVGQPLFKIVDPSALRIELDLPVAKSGLVSLGDEVELDWSNGDMIKGKIDFIQPFFTEGQEFVKARVYVPNNDELKIGQLVRATIRLKPVEALWVPREAVLDLGVNDVVFVKEGDVFRARPVKVSLQTDGWVAIAQGLTSSEDVAINAQYLVDSESFIKVK
ncbi:MAG TPA: efflux RND transporter periplasmic adaptor subunit [Cyclobacteriaceae bacterium]|nr:efflux RND transporter periplasmic adaptor subunit [Cyclobacteriaceae bacterium]